MVNGVSAAPSFGLLQPVFNLDDHEFPIEILVVFAHKPVTLPDGTRMRATESQKGAGEMFVVPISQDAIWVQYQFDEDRDYWPFINSRGDTSNLSQPPSPAVCPLAS